MCMYASATALQHSYEDNGMVRSRFQDSLHFISGKSSLEGAPY